MPATTLYPCVDREANLFKWRFIQPTGLMPILENPNHLLTDELVGNGVTLNCTLATKFSNFQNC